MLRLLVTGYLAIVVAAGPAICCCSFGKAFAQKPAASEPAPAEQSCCCKHTTPSDDAEQTRPRPAPAKCPCRESTNCARFMPAIVPLTDRIVADWLTMLAAALPTVDAASATLGLEDRLPNPIVAGHRPFWDPHDLLDLHHRLRC
jgi:hypothetical protein